MRKIFQEHTDLKLVIQRTVDYLEKRVNQKDKQEIENHISNCDDCQNITDLVFKVRENYEVANAKNSTYPHLEPKDISDYIFNRFSEEKLDEIQSHTNECNPCSKSYKIFEHLKDMD